MKYLVSHIAEIVGGTLIQQISEDAITNILTDSRHIDFPHNSIFFAIDGQQHDGHNFIQDCNNAGVQNFVISKKNLPLPHGNIILVDHSLKALQTLAAHHRSQFSFPVIGITGSNGKTIVKEWLYQLLKDEKRVVRSPRSYNSQLGVPLSVLLLQPEHEIALIEAGISRTGEMQHLQKIIRPTHGILTNIGSAHDEGFSNIKEKISEKLKLFEDVKLLIYRSDNPLVQKSVDRLSVKTFRWSTTDISADFYAAQLNKQNNVTEVIGYCGDEEKRFVIPFTDKASVENAIHCWLTLMAFDHSEKQTNKRLQLLDPVGMRLQLIEGVNGCVVINDSYNSDIQSLRIALDVMAHQPVDLRKTVILSDILQSGQDLKKLYHEVADYLIEKKVDRFIGVGEAVSFINNYLPEEVQRQFYPTTDAFTDHLQLYNFKDEVVLIKGARRFAFEKISSLLERKMHKTVLEVDLSALAFNLNVFRGFLKEGTKLMVMVKAFAYGSGLEVAKLLSFHKVDYLAVAYIDEGMEIRNAGVDIPVMIMNADKDNIAAMIEYDLEPEIYSFSFLRHIASYTSERDKTLKVHIKIDTGMNRLGFETDQIDDVVKFLHMYPQVRVRSVLTHLAASEDKKNDAYSMEQVDKFLAAYDRFKDELPTVPMAHVLNSAGIIRFPQWHMDMVRLGVGLYGINSSHVSGIQLKSVLTLKAIVSQVRDVKPGETIGYGRIGKVLKDMKIATVSVGYADGLPRAAGNGLYSLLIRGKKADIIGNVCMDMCMLDVTEINGVSEGDEVIVFGSDHPVESLAEVTGTIPYELFTRIPERVKRIYIQE